MQYFKVLRIIARLNIGGPARNAMLLTEGLSHSEDNSKYQTVLVCGQVDGNEGDMMYLAKEKGINPVIVKELGRELSIKNDWQAFWKIYRIICRERPDIIHTHTAKAGTLGRLAGILYNITHFGFKPKADRCKLIHTFHGHVLHSYFVNVKTLFFIWIERILALFTDRLITVSESLKKELVEKFSIAPEEKFSVIELGFELDELLNLQPKEASSTNVNIGIVGRLTSVKNHRMLFRVAKSIEHSAECMAKKKVKFVVIGDGELREKLENYVKELGIEDIVEFKGWVRQLRRIYEVLDIVALTSLNEGTPLSIIEAMAAAKPVVATKVGGVSDIVQDEKSGYIVECNNDDTFVDRLLDLIENGEKRIQFAKYGRELVRKRFFKERLIRDMEGLYNNLLKHRQEKEK